MKNQKSGLLFCILCWLGVAMSGVLTGYMLYFALQFPEVGDFTQNVYLSGALMLLWIAAAVSFTVRERKNKKK